MQMINLMQIKLRAYLFITFSLVGGALFPLALKVADNNGISIFAFMFMAYLIAAPASLLLVLARKKAAKLRGYLMNPKEFLLIGTMGFLSVAFADYGLIYAEQFVSASLATVIYRMQPLLMLLFLPILLKEKVSKIQIAALAIAFVGIYIALTGGSFSVFSGANELTITFLVFMTLIVSFSTVFLKRYTSDMESSMFMFNIVALAIASFLFIYSGAAFPILNPGTFAALLYIGIIANIAVPFFYYSSFRVLKTTFVTNLYFLSPFITILFAGLLLNEPIYAYYLIIAVLVAIGISIQRLDKKGGTYVSRGSKAAENYLQIFDVTSAFTNTKVGAIDTTMRGSGRVLAVKLDSRSYERIKEEVRKELERLGRPLFIYTNSDGHLVSEEENKFISDILEVRENETVLMSAGNPEESERLFDDVNNRLLGD